MWIKAACLLKLELSVHKNFLASEPWRDWRGEGRQPRVPRSLWSGEKETCHVEDGFNGERGCGQSSVMDISGWSPHHLVTNEQGETKVVRRRTRVIVRWACHVWWCMSHFTCFYFIYIAASKDGESKEWRFCCKTKQFPIPLRGDLLANGHLICPWWPGSVPLSSQESLAQSGLKVPENTQLVGGPYTSPCHPGYHR